MRKPPQWRRSLINGFAWQSTKRCTDLAWAFSNECVLNRLCDDPAKDAANEESQTISLRWSWLSTKKETIYI